MVSSLNAKKEASIIEQQSSQIHKARNICLFSKLVLRLHRWDFGCIILSAPQVKCKQFAVYRKHQFQWVWHGRVAQRMMDNIVTKAYKLPIE